MTLSACALSGQGPKTVKVPNECDANALPVAYPGVSGDLGVVAARHRAALGQANGRLAAVKACNAKVRAEYAK